jgi:hypothetical protein
MHERAYLARHATLIATDLRGVDHDEIRAQGASRGRPEETAVPDHAILARAGFETGATERALF